MIASVGILREVISWLHHDMGQISLGWFEGITLHR